MLFIRVFNRRCFHFIFHIFTFIQIYEAMIPLRYPMNTEFYWSHFYDPMVCKSVPIIYIQAMGCEAGALFYVYFILPK